MSHQAGPGQTVAEIYKGVINDVILQMKETFLDENVDVDVLHQLKKDWEERVRMSKAVDLDGPKPAALQPPPPIRQNQRTLPQTIPQPQPRVNQPPQQYQTNQKPPTLPQVNYANRAVPMPISVPHQSILTHQTEQHRPTNQQATSSLYSMQQASTHQQTSQPQLHQFQTLQGTPNFPQLHATTQLRMVPNTGQQQQGQQQFIMHNPSGIPQQVMLIGGQGQQFLAANQFMGQRIVLQTQQQAQQQLGNDQHHVRQIDGNDSHETEICEEVPGPSNLSPRHVSESYALRNLKELGKPKRVKGKELQDLLKRLGGIIQIDGNGMTDSSSEEEEIEDDDPLQSMVNRIHDKDDGDDDDQAIEEAPLNSEDDQSDDEDVETLFAADNIVVCQFEKVGRTRQKWKFNLKDGIMHINGRDYCFQKCTGEAEW